MAGIGKESEQIITGTAPKDVAPVVESPPSPERPRLKLIKTAAISGPSFAGKDEVVRILRERHGWPVFDGSSVDFERRQSGSGTPIQRGRREHIGFDRLQALRFSNLQPGDEMWLHQTRLGGIIRAAEEDKRAEELTRRSWQLQRGENPPPLAEIPAVSILLWASKEVREQRAVNHANKLADKDGKPRPTRTEVVSELERKQKSEVNSWAPRYRTIDIRPNPFSRFLKRKNGGPVYDRWVKTDDKTLEQVADDVEEVLRSLGAVEEINPAPQIVGGTLIDEFPTTMSAGKPMVSRDPSATIGVISPGRRSKTDRTLEPA